MTNVILMQRATPPVEVRVIKSYLESKGCEVYLTGRHSKSGFNAYRENELTDEERQHLNSIEEEYLANPVAFRRKHSSSN
jgi:hypothetical protein